MKVINLYAGPCAGKTTHAHDLTAYLKKRGYNVEFIPEYAKTLVYQERKELAENQIHIFNEQLKHNIKLHKPHPGNILKRYQNDFVLDVLKSNNLL